MKNTETRKKNAVFQLAKKHFIFALFRLAANCTLVLLFLCKNKLPANIAAAFSALAAATEISIFLLIFAKTFTRKKNINFPHYMIFVLEAGVLASLVNYFSGGSFKSTLFIAGATAVVSAFYFFTFLLKQKIAEK